MTKENIIKILASEDADFKINDVFRIIRYKKDALGYDTDRLFLVASYVSGVKGGKTYEITARDYACVMLEIADSMKEYFTECAEKSISGFLSGASI